MAPFRKPNRFFLSLFLGIIIGTAFGAQAASKVQAPPGSYKVSWLGNSFAGASNRWVQNFFIHTKVQPDGTVNTWSHWDEGGKKFGVYKDGDVIGNTNVNPNSLQVTDKAGRKWKIEFDYVEAKFHEYDFKPKGITCDGESVTFPELYEPMALALANDGQLMIADSQTSPRQQVLFYEISDVKKPKLTRAFGDYGGIASGKPGEVTPTKFWGIRGIGMDAQGNLYVAMSEMGSCLRKFSPQGKLLWELRGDFFVDVVSADPTSDALDIWGIQEHYKMDFTQPPGREAKLVGYSLNRHKYPNDPRGLTYVKQNGEHGLTSPQVVYIKGKRYLFVGGMFASNFINMLPHEPAQIKQHTDTSDLRVYSTTQREVFVRCPLHLGGREWALAVLKNPGVVTEAREFTLLTRLSAKYGGFPLDKVKDWVLEWPDAHSYAVNPADRDSKLGKDYREVTNLLGRFVREALDFPRGGERTGINSFPNNTANFVQKAKVLLDSGQLTAEQGRLLRAQAAFLTYLLRDDDYFPPRRNGYGGGSANMPVSVARGRMDTAAGLPDHPLSKTWLADSAKVMGYVINANFGEDGSPQSNPHYMGLLTDAAVSTARLLKERGAIQDEKTAFPHFHKAARFLIDMVTPYDLRLKQRLVPTVGDGYWEKHQNALTVAPVFKESDPELAANLLWAARTGGLKDASVPGLEPNMPNVKSVLYPGWGAFLRHVFNTESESYVGIRFGDFTLDHTHNDAGSINWYARGVPLSLDFATMYTPHTPGAWLHSTLTYDHMEHASPVKCPGRGHPDCFYTGKTWYQHEFEPHTLLEPIPDRASTEFTEVHGKITAFATEPSADYVRGEANRRWLERKPYYWRNQGSPSPWGQFSEFNKTELQHPFRWVRQYAFVKDEKPEGPCYLVIADDLTGNEELTPAFNFWCLANEVKEVASRHYHFTGQHGLDLELFALAPSSGPIQLGEWGHKQGFLIGERGLEESQKLARIYGRKGGQSFLVVLYPRSPTQPEPKVEALANGKLVRLTLPDQTHWILLSNEPVPASDGPVKLTGTATVLKRWNDGRVLATLLAPGEAKCGDVQLKTNTP